jgi:predicted nucleotide-binding protein
MEDTESSQMPTKVVASNEVDAKTVFVVHGRNSAARKAMFEFLRAIGLHPLEWEEIVDATGKASPYIGEVLEKGFQMAKAVVVLMTPDDEARLRKQFHVIGDPPHEVTLNAQPRPNVLIEAGMALSLHPDRTVIVELGHLRPASDLLGLHVVRMSNSSQQRQVLARRLGTAGCEINLSGTDWHTAGDFNSALEDMPYNAHVALPEERPSETSVTAKPDQATIAVLANVYENLFDLYKNARTS